MQPNERIIIIGGGLSGLSLAYLLSKRNIQATILEASNRLGGRIQTVKGIQETPLELGATWVSDMHPNMLALIDELGLKKFPQFSRGISLFHTKSFVPPQKFFIPDPEDQAYRLAGGTQMLIEVLIKKIAPGNIHLNTKVSAINDINNELLIETSTGQKHFADKVFICIPPQLAGLKIQYSPELPSDVSFILPGVQTFMAGSIKFAVEYAKPFWRNAGYSGMLYSHVDIITEMYDHTNFEENKFGIKGFLNGSVAAYPENVRKEFVLKQLSELLGQEALKPLSYHDKVWNDEFVSAGNQVLQRPSQYNGDPLLQQNYMGGKLFFSGSETSTDWPGYMEGAITSAQRIAEKFRSA